MAELKEEDIITAATESLTVAAAGVTSGILSESTIMMLSGAPVIINYYYL